MKLDLKEAADILGLAPNASEEAIQDTHIDGEFCYVYKDGFWTYLAGNSLRRLTEKNTTPKGQKG